MKATAPIGSGCRIKPSTVAIKTASKCQASGVTPSGTGRNHRMSPTPIVMSAFLLFVFMCSPHQKYELSAAVPFLLKAFPATPMEAVDLQSIRPRSVRRGAVLRLGHSQNKGSPFLRMREETAKYPCLAACSAEVQKITAETTPQRCGSIRRKTQIPSPSLAGQTVIVDQAVLLAPVHRSSAPSQVSSVTFSADSLTDTVAGPRRLFRLLY